MNRRMFLGRFLGGVGVAALGAGTAKALVRCPEAGQTNWQAVPHEGRSLNFTPEIVPPDSPKEEWWQKPVEWLGDPLDHNKPLSEWLCFQPSANGQIMQEFFQPHSDAEFVEALEFYLGNQWPQNVHEARMRESRPALTINMVKAVLGRAIVVSTQRGEETRLTEREWREVIVNIYRRNRDAQLHYNALQSARLEMMMLDPKKYGPFGTEAFREYGLAYAAPTGFGYIRTNG